ncbi:hypothetical protein GCM10025858_19420 [Alicyclobacillus sacchari]|uniref:LacI family DNA-binding transcriptional regulator n=1 Tax=Alicyclobacillus sacchari TaxID=392010 RepID=UPI0023E91493|nr:LacI family DNA-binding transcriptional regulator [Alicyclobacillus sacchari]GMA57439.1 hypothetical protein GCM10025858_19420 [Alicyclobacillus sacchari]
MATIKDVARLANVSPSTVSRVLSNSSRISEETKRRVREALEQLDYHPNVFARGLVTNSTGAIGILIPPSMNQFFVNPFFAEWMSGVSEVAREHGVDTVLSTSARDEEEVVDRMVRGRVSTDCCSWVRARAIRCCVGFRIKNSQLCCSVGLLTPCL